MEASIRELTKEAVDKRAVEIRRELFEMRIKKGFGQLEVSALPRTRRRELARLLTVKREDELGLRALKGTRNEVEVKKPSAKAEAKAAQRAKAPAAEAGKAKDEAAKTKEDSGKPGKAKGFFDRFRLRRSGARGR